MADNKKITQLDPVSSLTGAESFEVVQVGENRRVSWTQIKSLLLEYFYTIFPSYFQSTITTSATPTPTGNYKENELYITALGVAAVIAAPTGTALNGNTLIIRIKDNGTARALSFNAIYRGIGEILPITTTIGKTIYIGAIYNSTDVKWDIVTVKEEL